MKHILFSMMRRYSLLLAAGFLTIGVAAASTTVASSSTDGIDGVSSDTTKIVDGVSTNTAELEKLANSTKTSQYVFSQSEGVDTLSIPLVKNSTRKENSYSSKIAFLMSRRR